MRRYILPAILVAALASVSPAFGLALKFAPAGGAVWAVGDQIEETEIGFTAGGSIEAEVWKGFDYGLRYLFTNVNTVMPNTYTDDTTVTSIDADLVYHSFALTNAWSPGWKWVDPYVRGSVGLHSWQQLDENGDPYEYTVIGEADTTVNELKATSFGIGFGGGLRIWPTDWLGLRLGVDYDLIFSENRDDFGTTDANENLFKVGGEVIFRVPVN